MHGKAKDGAVEGVGFPPSRRPPKGELTPRLKELIRRRLADGKATEKIDAVFTRLESSMDEMAEEEGAIQPQASARRESAGGSRFRRLGQGQRADVGPDAADSRRSMPRSTPLANR